MVLLTVDLYGEFVVFLGTTSQTQIKETILAAFQEQKSEVAMKKIRFKGLDHGQRAHENEPRPLCLVVTVVAATC